MRQFVTAFKPKKKTEFVTHTYEETKQLTFKRPHHLRHLHRYAT